MAACRLYLVTPPGADPDALAPRLDAALATEGVDCVLLAATGLDEAALRAAAARLRPVVQDRGVAFLLDGRADLAARTACDGVHLGAGALDYAAARRAVGPNGIVGAGCGASRHDAMVAAEDGADYVAFGPPAIGGPADEAVGLVAWWAELMEVPCVAFGAATADEAARLATAGADFVAVDRLVWDHVDGPAAAIEALARRLAAPRVGLGP